MFGASPSPPRSTHQQGNIRSASSPAADNIITELDCSQSVVGDRGLRALLPVLRRVGPDLRVLRFEKCGLGDASVTALLALLPTYLPRLELLDLRQNNNISHDAGKQIHRLVLHKLTERDRSHKRETRVSDAEAKARAEIAGDEDTTWSRIQALLETPHPIAHPTVAEKREGDAIAEEQHQQQQAVANDGSVTAAQSDEPEEHESSSVRQDASTLSVGDDEPVEHVNPHRGHRVLKEAMKDEEDIRREQQEQEQRRAAAEAEAIAAAEKERQATAAEDARQRSLVVRLPPIRPRFLVSSTNINAGLVRRIEDPELNAHQTFSPLALDTYGDLVIEARGRQLMAISLKERSANESEESAARASLSSEYGAATVVAVTVRHEKAAIAAKDWMAEQRREIEAEKAERALQKAKEEEEQKRAAESKCVLQ
jgi:hypothetical protein